MNSDPSFDPLEAQLRRDAQRPIPAPSLGLDGRISQAVARSSQPKRSARARLLSWTSALGAGTALAAVLLLVLRPAGPSAAESAEERAISAGLAQSVEAMPAQFLNTIQPQAERAFQNEPMQTEATALAADAHSAVNFLAYNFLPVSPR